MRRTGFLAITAVLVIGAGDPPPAAPAGPSIPMSTPVVRFQQPPACYKGCLSPVDAVTYASYLGERAGVAADFEMTVRAVGEKNGRFFLNSELDYRDRNCLTVAVPAMIAQGILGESALDALRQRYIGKRIVVRGIAQRVQIVITDDKSQRTDKYYFQVHVPVGSPQQMLVKP